MTRFEADRDALQVEIRDGVAALTLNRPAAMNAMSPSLARALAEALSELPSDGSVRAVLVTGAGKAFCSGGDIRAMSDALEQGPREFFLELTEYLHRISRSLLEAGVPTVAAVNGPAAGFGFGLALSCDLVIASERATFTMAHGQVAQIPDGGGWYLLPRVVGRKRALDLYLTRHELDAQTAERWGIVTRILPVTNVREVAMGFARDLAQGPTMAYREAKRRLAAGWDQPFEEYLDEQRRVIADLGASRDFEEGVRAFLERRAPMFRGE
jgi:2-(1,2-epoxy-1,2-dihydrophenyl)acetyl-CoA isomerase